MRFKRLVRMVVPLLFCLALLTGCASARDYKGEIFALVEQEKDVIAAGVSENDFSDALSLELIESVAVLEPCVNFYCGGYGISTSSCEFGFYYSFDDQPLGVWQDCVFAFSDQLTAEGGGYAGEFQHNRYYTEKICDNFWYYELQF